MHLLKCLIKTFMDGVMGNLLEIHDFEVSVKGHGRNVKIIDGIDLSIAKGSIMALVGESGSGKTTLAMSVMGLQGDSDEYIYKGKINYNGTQLQGKSDLEMRSVRGKEISMIFQDPLSALNPAMTIGEQIEELLKIHFNLPKSECKVRVLRVMKEVGLPNPSELYNYYPAQLSGGMKQRVIIAMSIICDPGLLIADEPTTALDVTTQAQIISLIKELKKSKNLTVLFITHDFGVVAEIADSVTIMYCGVVMEYGPVGEVFKTPRHPYTIELMKCMPYIGKRMDELHTISGAIPHPVNRPKKGCIFYSRCSYGKSRCGEYQPPVYSFSEGRGVKCFYWGETKI